MANSFELPQIGGCHYLPLIAAPHDGLVGLGKQEPTG